ncbi:probable G-protein coupled receptor 139 [Pristis pectinata]|uniref:probable G-protein coupled receptor 139 n=1 Tax=Pristis pectinata TaxID=685728 RepID=UPI00223D5575|nr:probable G-protein coupled receptor 139 [Pristis pectinata]
MVATDHKGQPSYYEGMEKYWVNLVAIAILCRGMCSLSKCITPYLVAMAAGDLLVVLTDPLLRWTGQIYFPYSLLRITPVCSLTVVLLSAATNVSVWLTVAFTFDRFVAICCEQRKAKYCTERTAALVVGTVSVLSCLVAAPWYFIHKEQRFINGVPWYCKPKLSFYSSSVWAAFDIVDRVLTPFLPFFLILLLNALTVRRILESSRVRKGLRVRNNGENDIYPDMENRRRSIVLLFSLNGSFILLWMTKVVFNIYVRIAHNKLYLTQLLVITQETAFMLQLFGSCTKTCIYILTQSRFREELKNAVRYPMKLIVKCVKPKYT